MEGSILFLHGLEAGITGTKGLFLRQNFKNCIYPDLEVSIYKLNEKNSFLRLIIFNYRFIGLLAALSLISYLLYSLFGAIIGITLSTVLFTTSIFYTKNYFLRNAVKKALDNNVSLAYSQIQKHKPKVIIGSSWGGCIALKLIEKQLWNGHTIVLAPAFYAVNKVVNNNRPDLVKSFQLRNLSQFKGKIIVYHSIVDTVIPFKDSEILCENHEDCYNTFELRVLENDNHSLKSLIEEPDYRLKKDIEELLFL